MRLFTDFRYAEAARAVDGVEFVETKRSLVAALAELLEGSVGFEADAVSYASWEVAARGRRSSSCPRRGLVETLRAVKDDGELDAIRRAGAITSEAYERLAEERFVGRTERELAWRLDELFHEHGADALGLRDDRRLGPERGAKPHARPTDRTIEAGETVVVDAGATVDGYSADCTRTFATGAAAGRARGRPTRSCLEAQLAGARGDRAPGVTGVDADAAARDEIDAAGFGENFGHGLGHGVGLEVHEAPRLSPRVRATRSRPATSSRSSRASTSRASAAIRIEDLVVVTRRRARGADALRPRISITVS